MRHGDHPTERRCERCAKALRTIESLRQRLDHEVRRSADLTIALATAITHADAPLRDVLVRALTTAGKSPRLVDLDTETR